MAAGLNMTDAEIELLLRRVHSGEVSVFNLPVDLYKKLGAKLSGAVKDGYSIDFDKVALDSPDRETVRAMQNNTYVFSAAKTFQQVNDMSNAVFDQDGMARPFRLFELDAKRIFDTYNKTWLKAEYATAKEAGRSAKRWARIEETADIFPYLEYRTRRDSRVRPEHAEMDGILLPVTDPFWDTHTPPNGWGCNNRCRLIKRRDPKADEVTQLEKVKLDPKEVPGDLAPEVFIRKRPGMKPLEIAPNPKLFNLNFGKEKLVFPESSKGLGIDSHPYFRVHRRFKTLKDNNFNMPLPSELLPPATPPKPPVRATDPVKRLEVAKRKIKKLKPIEDRIAEVAKKWLDNKRDTNRLADEIAPMKAGPEREKKIKELQKLLDRTQVLREAKNKARAKYVDDVVNILAQPTSAKMKVTTTLGVDQNISKSWDQGRDAFSKIVGDRPALRNVEIKATLQGRGRAGFVRPRYRQDRTGQYVLTKSRVDYSRGDMADTIAHELSHFLEFEDRQYFDGVKEFYKRRTKGYITERLIDRNPAYDADERTNADTFIDPYTGKIYSDATEITPMFFTHCFTDIHKFIKEDPDHFNSIFKLLNEPPDKGGQYVTIK